jgi:hypothetical protein
MHQQQRLLLPRGGYGLHGMHLVGFPATSQKQHTPSYHFTSALRPMPNALVAVCVCALLQVHI